MVGVIFIDSVDDSYRGTTIASIGYRDDIVLNGTKNIEGAWFTDTNGDDYVVPFVSKSVCNSFVESFVHGENLDFRAYAVESYEEEKEDTLEEMKTF